MKTLIPGICAALALLSSCGTPDPDLTCDASPPAATLATNVQAVFSARCSQSCHLANDTYGDYTDAAKTQAATAKSSLYADQMTKSLQVADNKGSLANSSLWLKVLGGATAGRTGPKGENVYGKMPNDSTMLTADEKKLIKDWICGGAK